MTDQGRRRTDVPRRVLGTCLVALAVAMAATGCGTSKPKSEAAHTAGGGGGVRLSPDPATAASRIDVVFEDRFLDPTKCRFRWKRNGSTITGAYTSTLEPVHVSKGSVIAVEVLYDDPASGQTRELKAEVQVENTPPKVSRVTLVMTAASGGPEVRANVESADPDRDEVSYGYAWYKNDVRVEGLGSAGLPMAGLTRGDRVAVEVVASDGQSSAPAVRSEVLEVENSPPSFSSKPMAPRPSDVEFRYQAVAVDPDGDKLVYSLVSGPLGMILAPNGSATWLLPPADQRSGQHRIRIKATDSKGGEAFQEFSLDLESAQRKP